MKKYLLFLFILHSAFYVSFAQLSLERSEKTPQQKLLRSQIKKAEGKLFYPENENNLRDSRAVIFYDDFSVPGNWTMTNASSPSYDWEILDSMPSNLISQNFGPSVNSTSGGNFAIVNSDLQGNSATQNCNLTTINSIDCSSNPNVQLRFENYHRIFYETHTVYVSNDGVNFDPYPVNTTYGAGNNNYVTSPNVEEVVVNITATAGSQPTVWLRFNYIGSWDYFWIIDDVTIEDQPDYAATMVKAGYCDWDFEPVLGEYIEHTILPYDQIRPLKIMADYKAIGSLTCNDAYFKTEIYNSSNGQIFSDTSLHIDLTNVWQTDSIVWNNTMNIDSYEIRMSVEYDSAATTVTADSVNQAYWVATPGNSPNTNMARDENIFSANGIWNGNGNAYILGNEFYMTNNMTIYGVKVALTPGTDVGASLCAILYEMDPAAATFNDVFVPVVDACLDGVEFVINSSHISSGPNIVWMTLLFSQPYILQAGKSYVAAVNHYGGTEDVVIMNGGSTFRGAATCFIYDPTATTGGPWFYTTEIPMIRLYTALVGVEENKNNTFSLQQNRPNPATNETFIPLTLYESSEVQLKITDMAGRTIYEKNTELLAAGEHQLFLNTSDFASGIYYYTVCVDDVFTSGRMTINH